MYMYMYNLCTFMAYYMYNTKYIIYPTQNTATYILLLYCMYNSIPCKGSRKATVLELNHSIKATAVGVFDKQPDRS